MRNQDAAFARAVADARYHEERGRLTATIDRIDRLRADTADAFEHLTAVLADIDTHLAQYSEQLLAAAGDTFAAIAAELNERLNDVRTTDVAIRGHKHRWVNGHCYYGCADRMLD